MMNMYWEPLEFQLPKVPDRGWVRAIDTSLASPADIVGPGSEQPVDASTYLVPERSIAVLASRPA